MGINKIFTVRNFRKEKRVMYQYRQYCVDCGEMYEVITNVKFKIKGLSFLCPIHRSKQVTNLSKGGEKK
jgi:hypothetical protein